MNRKWLYNHEEGGKIFDITTGEYTEAVDSGVWFDRPDKVKEPAKEKPKYTKHALGRLSASDRNKIGEKYGVDLSKLARKDQIEEILKLQG